MFQLVAIEYMPKTFTTGKGQSLEDMKQEIKGDRSGANIHVAFLDDNCGGSSDCGGGMAVTGPICGRDSVALCNIHSSPSLMGLEGHVQLLSAPKWTILCETKQITIVYLGTKALHLLLIQKILYNQRISAPKY